MKGLEHLCYEERLREMGLCSPEKKKVQGNLTNVYKYLKGGCKKVRARISSVMPRDRIRGDGHKWRHGGFSLNIRKYFCPVRVTEQWHRSLREVVESPSLGGSEVSLLGHQPLDGSA